MGCFPDFCLACDRQTTGGPYCSQACRLTDLERGSAGSEPVLPPQQGARPAPWQSSYHYTDTTSPSPSPSPFSFCLPPPVDFAAYRQSRSGQTMSAQYLHPARTAFDAAHPSHWPPLSSSPLSLSRTDLSRHALPLSSRIKHTSARLTPSSSQTSLTSLQSNTWSVDDCQLSDQIQSELRRYTSAFDVTRDHKRRLVRA
ncbi:MAG: hypothetical protein M1815_002712 [Lichina confinis]|nr:MAG: hypothetical protein M1815_002712 [Lichina confinis]